MLHDNYIKHPLKNILFVTTSSSQLMEMVNIEHISFIDVYLNNERKNRAVNWKDKRSNKLVVILILPWCLCASNWQKFKKEKEIARFLLDIFRQLFKFLWNDNLRLKREPISHCGMQCTKRENIIHQPFGPVAWAPGGQSSLSFGKWQFHWN